MTAARFILSLPPDTHDATLLRAEEIENHLFINALAVVVNEVDEAAALWQAQAYFAVEQEAQDAARQLALTDFSIAPIVDRDWVRESLEGLPPVIAGRFFLHGTHDRSRRRPSGISLEIDAGTAFGTGHHGTTAGCLLALDTILKKTTPRNVFDLGCGTGVLAIAAARVTHCKTLATDIDPEATRVTQLNARRNGVGPMMNAATAAGLHHTIIARQAPYDLIFANILARPLAVLAQGIANILAPGGAVILSGLTRDQIRWIAARYRNAGLIRSATYLQDNWAILVFIKKSPR
jgi:ribosomal protein L11 methyltransferase